MNISTAETLHGAFAHPLKIAHRTFLAGMLAASLGLAGCATGAQSGALVGAGAGAAVGASAAGRGSRGEAALAGAAIGALLGAIIGSEADRQRYREGDYVYENEVFDWDAMEIRDETDQQRRHNDDLRDEYEDVVRLAEDANDPRLSPAERRDARDAVRDEQERARDAIRAVEYRLADVDDALDRDGMNPNRRTELRAYRRELAAARATLEDIIDIRV